MHHSEIICIYVARELNIDDINDDEALKQLFYIVLKFSWYNVSINYFVVNITDILLCFEPGVTIRHQSHISQSRHRWYKEILCRLYFPELRGFVSDQTFLPSDVTWADKCRCWSTLTTDHTCGHCGTMTHQLLRPETTVLGSRHQWSVNKCLLTLIKIIDSSTSQVCSAPSSRDIHSNILQLLTSEWHQVKLETWDKREVSVWLRSDESLSLTAR